MQDGSLALGQRFLLELALTVGPTLAGLGAIALVCFLAVPPIVHDAAFEAQVTVLDGFFYPEQPAKSLAYQAGCLALPFLIGFSFCAARRWTQKLSNAAVEKYARVALAIYALIIVSCAIPIVYCPHPPLWFFPPAAIVMPVVYPPPFVSAGRVLALVVAAAFGFYLLQRAGSRRRSKHALVFLLLIWVMMLPGRFYLSSEVSNDLPYLYHFNAVFDALSQVTDGHHVLVDFPHIYGGYIEFLAPIMRLFPRDPSVPLTLLGLTNITAISCLLVAVGLIVRRPLVLFVCGLTTLAVTSITANTDLNYGYLTARLCLAPIALLCAILYFRRSSPIRYGLTSVLAALAPIWNLDTGIVFWVSWTATLCVIHLAGRNFAGLVRTAAIQLAVLVAAWIVFLLYLRLASGHWPNPALLFYFQNFVVSTGYFCLPLVFPDTWLFIIIVYLIGLAVAIATYARGQASWRTPVILLLSLFGIGLFSYFMGRSAPPNLIAVSYPAVLIAGILCSEGQALIGTRRLPAVTRLFLLPLMLAMFWWSFLMIAAVPEFLHHSAHSVRHWDDARQTPFRANAAFVTAQVHPQEQGVFFLSNNSGFYYYLSDTTRPLPIPGMIELLQARDMNALIDAIQKRRIAKLFVEQNFYAIEMYRPDIYDSLRTAVSANYRVVATGSTGKIMLCVPK